MLSFSCSSDDDSGQTPEPPIPIEKRYLSNVYVNGTDYVQFEYYADKTLKKIIIQNTQIRYEYENGQVSKIYLNDQTDFDYDANGTLIGYTQNNILYPIEYVQNTNSYKFRVEYSTYEVFLNENHDIVKYTEKEDNSNDVDEIYFFYEPNYGSYTNINPLPFKRLS